MKTAPKTVFEFTSYKACLAWLLERASAQAKGQKSKLAAFMNCQPAYLSRVMNGDADLSLEQGEAVARFFVLNKAETLYFLAVLGEERSGTQELKKFWRQQKTQALAERTELKSRIETQMTLTDDDKTKYFSQWYHAAIHAAVSIKDLQTAEALAKYFRLDDGTTRASLEFLCSVGLIVKSGQRYVSGITALHLDKASPLVGRHHLNWKIKSMEAVNQPKTTDIQYTSVVSLSRADLEKLREIIFDAIESMRSVVKDSKEEILACYNFDFFDLNRSPEKGPVQ